MKTRGRQNENRCGLGSGRNKGISRSPQRVLKRGATKRSIQHSKKRSQTEGTTWSSSSNTQRKEPQPGSNQKSYRAAKWQVQQDRRKEGRTPLANGSRNDNRHEPHSFLPISRSEQRLALARALPLLLLICSSGIPTLVVVNTRNTMTDSTVLESGTSVTSPAISCMAYCQFSFLFVYLHT